MMGTGGKTRRKTGASVVAMLAMAASLLAGGGVSSGQPTTGSTVHESALAPGAAEGFGADGALYFAFYLAVPLEEDPTQTMFFYFYPANPNVNEGCNGAIFAFVVGADTNRQPTAGQYGLSGCGAGEMTHIRDLAVQRVEYAPGTFVLYIRVPAEVAGAQDPHNSAATSCTAATGCAAGGVLSIDFGDDFVAALFCYGRPVTVFGTVHGDEIEATDLNEVIRTFGGDDIVLAGGGADVVCLDEGDDVGRGQGGNDTIYGDAQGVQTPGDDAISGGAGDDDVFAGPGDDTVSGGAGGDNLRGESGVDRLMGDGGDDTLNGGQGADMAWGGGGNDTVLGGGGSDTLNGNRGADDMRGGPGADTMSGHGGSDTMSGGPGMDNLNGGGGNDELSGNGGRDNLNGGGGNRDQVEGNGGRDTLAGGNGRNDSCIGGPGIDRLANPHGCESFVGIP